jgi:hypothetical protein
MIGCEYKLKKPIQQQGANLEGRLKLNAERADAIRGLLKEQQRVLDNLRKVEEEMEIIAKEQSTETKAVLEKY